MKYSFTLSLIIAIFLGLTHQAEKNAEITELNTSTFSDFIKENEKVLVLYYSNDFPHSKLLKNEYQSIANSVKAQGVKAVLIDADQSEELIAKFEIKMFPTIQLYLSEDLIHYYGGNNEVELVNWVKSKVGRTVFELKTYQALKEAITDNEVIIVYFGQVEDESYKIYDNTSKHYDDVVFCFINDTTVISKAKVTETPAITIYKDESPTKIKYTNNEITQSNIIQFIEENQFGPASLFSQRVSEKVFGKNKPCFILFLGQDDKSKEIKEMYKTTAEKLKGKVLLTVQQVEEGFGERIAEFLEIEKSTLPSLRLIWPTDTEVRKYVYQEELTEENILAFFKKFEEGQLVSTYKSEEVPDNSANIIKKIVGLNFKDIVLDNSKNVLLKIEAPWCDECEQLNQIFEELYNEIKNFDNDFVVAKMDATLNEFEGLIIDGFPDIKLYLKDQKSKPKIYEGEYNLDDLSLFIKQHLNIEIQKKAAETIDNKEKQAETKETVEETEEQQKEEL